MQGYPVLLEVVAEDWSSNGSCAQFRLTLRDEQGHCGSGAFTLDPDRKLPGGLSWRGFRALYAAGLAHPSALREFGTDLLKTLLGDRELFGTWKALCARAGGAPLRMTVQLGPGTERFAALPLEAMHDEHGFLFAWRGSGLVRTLLGTPARKPILPEHPRVLFAWACPQGEEQFDPAQHRDALSETFGDACTELPRVSLEALEAELSAPGNYSYLHLLAHGYVQDGESYLVLHDGQGRRDPVRSQTLAETLRGRGLQLAFLCSCDSATADFNLFSGLAQGLLSHQGADIPCVIATQAKLPILGSAELAGSFYRLLSARHDPTTTLAAARLQAFDWANSTAWSVPIVLARPPAFSPQQSARHFDFGGRGRLAVFVGREAELGELDRAVGEGSGAALVAVRGFAGVGKSSLLYEWLAGKRDTGQGPFEALISYCAYRLNASYGGFLEFVLASLGEPIPAATLPRRLHELAARVVAALRNRRVLLAIDGLERWLRGWQDSTDLDPNATGEGQPAADPRDRREGRDAEGMEDFLASCTALSSGARLVFTTRALPVGLDTLKIASISGAPGGGNLTGLDPAAGASLLRALGMAGEGPRLEALSIEHGGHPLTLTVLAQVVRDAALLRADPTSALPAALREILATLAGEHPPQPVAVTDIHPKLSALLELIETRRPDEVPILAAAAACYGDAPLLAIAAVLGADRADWNLRRRLHSLEAWGLLETYSRGAGDQWIALHPLLKRHFRPRASRETHRILSRAFQRMQIPAGACTLEGVKPRLWAIQHALEAGDVDRGCELLFEDAIGGSPLCEWFASWGYLDYEIEIEKQLFERASKPWRSRLGVSLAHNLTKLGRLEEAAHYLCPAAPRSHWMES